MIGYCPRDKRLPTWTVFFALTSSVLIPYLQYYEVFFFFFFKWNQERDFVNIIQTKTCFREKLILT